MSHIENDVRDAWKKCSFFPSKLASMSLVFSQDFHWINANRFSDKYNLWLHFDHHLNIRVAEMAASVAGSVTMGRHNGAHNVVRDAFAIMENLFFTSRKEERLVKNGHPSPDGHNKAIFHVNYSYHLASVAIVERFSTDENKRLLFSKLSWWKYSIKNTKSTSQTISDDSIDTFIFKTVTYARTKPLISLIRDSTSNLFDYTENRVSNRASVISLNI